MFHNTILPLPSSGLCRELKARHLTMISIGGSIGSGLFVASGVTISQAVPGALLSYALIGLIFYFLMTSLGELAAYMPVSGSFITYSALCERRLWLRPRLELLTGRSPSRWIWWRYGWS